MAEEKKSFDELNLKENLLRGIFSYGFENPSNIQASAIPPMVGGKDIILMYLDLTINMILIDYVIII